MSLRDYFAAMALASVYRAPYDLTTDAYKASLKSSARTAYDMADAMLQARATGEKQ